MNFQQTMNMINDCLERRGPDHSGSDFLRRMKDWGEQMGWFSPKQIQAIIRIDGWSAIRNKPELTDEDKRTLMALGTSWDEDKGGPPALSDDQTQEPG